MATSSIVPLVAAAVAAAQQAARTRRSRLPQRGVNLAPAPGLSNSDLSVTEKACLHAMLEHLSSQKITAQFKSLSPSDHQTSKYGVWTWRRGERDVILTSMPRASMVEIVRDGADEAGFVWNTILKEWNDVVLPSGFGRGQCKCIVGVTVPKSVHELRSQRLRIRIKVTRRAVKQWWTAVTRAIKGGR